MEKENTNSGSVYVTVDGHLNPVHVSMKGTGEEGFLEFMLEDVEKALKETEMPTMGMMYYNVSDMGIVPRLREGNNDDYLRRLEKAMDVHGIKLHRYLALSEVVPVKVHGPAFKGRGLYPATYTGDVVGDKVRTTRSDSGDAG